MIKSIVSSKTRPIVSAAWHCASAKNKQQQRRLFAHGHIVGGGTCTINASDNKNSVEYDDGEDDRNIFLNTMGEVRVLKSASEIDIYFLNC